MNAQRGRKERLRAGDKGRANGIKKEKPISEDICRDKTELNTELLRAMVEPDIKKALEKAKGALAGGAYVDASEDKYGVTALMLASHRGRIELVELLVKNGADVNARDYEGLTALYYATRADHFEVMVFLQENWANE